MAGGRRSVNSNISKILIGKSRQFLAPYLDRVDGWRRRFLPELFKGMIEAGSLVLSQIARKARPASSEAMQTTWQSLRCNLGSSLWEKFEEKLHAQFAQDRAADADDWTPVPVDLSDLSKP